MSIEFKPRAFEIRPAVEPRAALVGGGEPVPASEVESDWLDVLEVVVLWGATVVATRHLERGASATLGDAPDTLLRLPAEVLGAEVFVVADAARTGFVALVPPGASAEIVRGGVSSFVAGPASIATGLGDRVTLVLGDFRVRVAHVPAGRKPRPMPISRRLRSGALGAVLGAAALHAGFLGAFAWSHPGLLGEDEAERRREELALMQQYLTASAESERDRTIDRGAEASAPTDAASAPGGGAKGQEGSLGREGAPRDAGRFGHAGHADPADASLSRERALAEVRAWTLFGMLSSAAGDPNAPTSPFGRVDALGADEASAMGNMFGASIHDSDGMGGLGLSGIGEGGDRGGLGVGLRFGDFLGHGGDRLGDPNGPGGFGTCRGEHCEPGFRPHAAKPPVVRPAGQTEIGGHIAPEIIQRIVRQSFGRFRSCYQGGLRDNPSLAGRVVSRFVVDRDGRVTTVGDGGSDLADKAVVSCVHRAFYSLSFPEHDGGLVTVVYPLAFAPE